MILVKPPINDTIIILSKGKKVCVIGPVSIRTYTGQDGQTHASMEVNAEDVEFLSPRSEAPKASAPANTVPADTSKPLPKGAPAGSQYVDPGEDELPFE